VYGVLIWECIYSKIWSLWRVYRQVSIGHGHPVTNLVLFRRLWHAVCLSDVVILLLLFEHATTAQMVDD
jgi:hypothetical protein